MGVDAKSKIQRVSYWYAHVKVKKAFDLYVCLCSQLRWCVFTNMYTHTPINTTQLSTLQAGDPYACTSRMSTMVKYNKCRCGIGTAALVNCIADLHTKYPMPSSGRTFVGYSGIELRDLAHQNIRFPTTWS